MTTEAHARIWAVRDTTTGKTYEQPNKLIAEKVAEMHGWCDVIEIEPPTEEAHGAVDEAARAVCDHEVLERAIGGVLFNVSNFPERAQSRLLGQNMRPLTEKLVDAMQAAGFGLSHQDGARR